MIYEYYCDTCEVSIEISRSMKDIIPKTVPCSCGLEARRIFGAVLKIPEYMKATDPASGTYAEFDNLKSKFSHASRPSGKDKIY